MNNIIIRLFDIIISTLLLIFFFPLLIVISITIFLIDGRPIIFKQKRVGYKGVEFKLFKFRTMKEFKIKNEELRLTFFGKILRRTSLDEIPQLLNVLKSDMSIVGPRPLPKEIEIKINWKLRSTRRKVLPGITGMSQINYTGKKRNLKEKVNLDIKFINDYTFYNYMKILFKTPMALVVRFFKNKSSIIK